MHLVDLRGWRPPSAEGSDPLMTSSLALTDRTRAQLISSPILIASTVLRPLGLHRRALVKGKAERRTGDHRALQTHMDRDLRVGVSGGPRGSARAALLAPWSSAASQATFSDLPDRSGRISACPRRHRVSLLLSSQVTRRSGALRPNPGPAANGTSRFARNGFDPEVGRD